MDWGKRLYTEEEINKAGEILRRDNASVEEVNNALEVLNNWRAIHNYPMHVFQVRLRDKAKILDVNSNTVQRLKRTPAIKFKLKKGWKLISVDYGKKNWQKGENFSPCRLNTLTV